MFFSNWFWFIFISSINHIFVDARIYKRSPILGGNETQSNNFRYVVAILSSQKGYTCTGGIISERFVLTAAHCFIDSKNHIKKDTFTVVAGTHNLRLESLNSIKVNIEQIFVPKTFKFDTLKADLAVAKLIVNLNVEEHYLQKLNLPTRFKRTRYGQQGVVAGFGACKIEKSRSGEKEVVDHFIRDGKLRSANVKIINSVDCKNSSYIEIENKDYNLLAKVIGNNNDVFGMCSGDSGSSLVDDSNTVIGVMSHSLDKGCDERKVPAVYTKVSTYISFIHRVLNGESKKHSPIKRAGSKTNCITV